MAESTITPRRPDGRPIREIDLPNLRRALRARYPGVTVGTCERREYAYGLSGMTIEYRAAKETLLRYGLASAADPRRIELESEWETVGCGSRAGGSGDCWHIYHHSGDWDPDMPGTRQWPPKGVQKEVERIWRRISKSVRREAG